MSTIVLTNTIPWAVGVFKQSPVALSQLVLFDFRQNTLTLSRNQYKYYINEANQILGLPLL